MFPLTPPPSWCNNEDMECPHSPILKQSFSLLAPLTTSPLRRKSNQPKRSPLSRVLAGRALAPSALLFPNIPVPALQQSARPAARKRGSEKLGLEEVKRDRKVAHCEAKKTKKTSTQDEGSGLLTSVSNASGSPQASTVLDTIRMDILEVRSNQLELAVCARHCLFRRYRGALHSRDNIGCDFLDDLGCSVRDVFGRSSYHLVNSG